jgi:peptidyl-prolyl cis-trans isomerase D
MILGTMRRHRRWLYVFLWLVIGAFIVLYIPAFQQGSEGGAGEALASVGGEPITVGEYQQAYLRQRQMYERLYQGRLDDAMLRNLALEQRVFDGLVTERLIRLEAQRLGLSVDDESLARAIASAPDLSENGRFIGAAELRRRLELQGIGMAEFERQQRVQLLAQKLQALVTDGVAVMPAEAEAEFRRRNEQVRAEYVLVDAGRFRAKQSATEAELQARYDADKQSYRIPERRVVSYLLVDPEPLRARVVLSDGDLQGYYDQHRDEFKEPEQVCASHILIKVASGAEGEGFPDDEARRRAEEALAKLRAGGDFAALAKASSQDEGSAAAGGDLGCFPRGRMVPEFENVAFDLAPGATSELVKTTFGYHVIRVQSRREETTPPLAQVKEGIRQTLTAQRLRALVEEQVGTLSAALRRGRGLEEAGRQVGLTVQKSPPMARGESQAPLASPVLASRVFELKPGEVDPEPFPLPRGWAFVAVAEVQPPRQPELKEVRAKVEADVLEQKALVEARAQAADLRARAATQGLEKAAASLGLLRKETPAPAGRGQPLGDLPAGRALDDAAFALPEKQLSEPVRVKGGYAVLRLLEKKPFDAAAYEAQRTALVTTLREQKQQQLFEAFLAEARQRHSVERRPDVIRRVLG